MRWRGFLLLSLMNSFNNVIMSMLLYSLMHAHYVILVSHYKTHTVQTKRHMLWFSTKSCSCYSTKTYVNSIILIIWKLNVTLIRKIHLNWSSLSTTHHTHFMYMFLIGVKFNFKIRIMLFT